MNWVTDMLNKFCTCFNGANEGNNSIRINNHMIRVVKTNELFSIKVIDFSNLTPPKQVNDIFYDELEMSLKEAIEETI